MSSLISSFIQDRSIYECSLKIIFLYVIFIDLSGKMILRHFYSFYFIFYWNIIFILTIYIIFKSIFHTRKFPIL